MSKYGLNFTQYSEAPEYCASGTTLLSLSLPHQQGTGTLYVNGRLRPVLTICASEVSPVGEDNGEKKPLKKDHFTLRFGHGCIYVSKTWQALGPRKSRLEASDCL